MPRLLFEKTGSAVWMSHLDLMRLFQRAFKRAELPLTHTQGFNPRPSVSIALPLSVGVESVCELLDFDLEGEKVAAETLCRRVNAALVPGVLITCQNPSLNPSLISGAIAKYLPEFAPDFVTYRREEIYDQQKNSFR